jgi:Protein of unknown function (DUF2934)
MASRKSAATTEPNKTETVTPPKVAATAKAVAAPRVTKVVAKKAVVKTGEVQTVKLQKVAAQTPAGAKPAAAAKPRALGKKVTQVKGPVIDHAQRANYIEVAAYYIAQRRGSAPGDPAQDYLNAAAEVDQLIVAGHFAK